jgi:glutathione S-transferase
VNTQLEHHKFLNGEQFTLPDAYLFVMLLWTFHFNIHLQEFPHLSRYFSELSLRKSIQKSLSEEGINLKA